MRKKSPLQIRIEYAVVAVVFWAYGLLPRGVAVKFGIFLASVGYKLLGGLRRTGMKNLELAFPEKPIEERENLLKASFKNLGRILGEVTQFHKYTKEQLADLVEFQFDPEAEKAVEDAAKNGRGAIIVSPHLGNWEVLVFAYGALHSPVSYLARPLDNPLIEDLTVRMRTRFGNRPINKTNSLTTALGILRKGNKIGILADVNAHPKEGIFVPFFGIPACTTIGVALLAIRTNALIIPMCGAWDDEKQKYVAVHGEIIEATITGDRDADMLATTAEYTAAVEKLVRKFPDQWLWIHKRWKTRPKGEPELY